MGRKKQTKEPVILTREQEIEKAIEEFRSFRDVSPDLIAQPTRVFEVGEKCQVGNLDNCVIVQKLHDSKAYVVEYDLTNRDGTVHGIRAWWWTDVDKPTKVKRPFENEFFRPYRRGQVTSCDLRSLMGMYTGNGLVVNPEYQRSYVWTDFDREQLLDTIFDRLDIGTMLFVRNQGYQYPEDTTPIRYNNLQGDVVFIPRNMDYTIEVIDGQQRVTTLIRYMLDMFPYRNKYYSELSVRDQADFETFSVSYRIINAEDITRRELLEMFLQVNRGVPQTEEHLDKVRKLYYDACQVETK